ncbi:helicase-related protein [Mesorhizobium sp. M0586]|uniref:helicase-related protein n=1 Tax=unclassified Mesorhizobium TaxID=325217 RepID=UPI003335026E
MPVPLAYLDEGQFASLKVLAASMKKHGAVLADEVGMGKTRIAVALALAVKRCGGRVAIVVPPVVAPQWREEFGRAGEASRDMLRSFDGLIGEYEAKHVPRMDDPIVILSHRFGDLRAKSEGTRWRADLLKLVVHRATPGLRKGVAQAPWPHMDASAAAEAIGKATQNCVATRYAVDEIAMKFRNIADRAALDDPRSDRFGNHTSELRLLESCLGLALGAFDLVIIDEAHKTRSEWGKLEALLGRVILRRRGHARVLGMTATPVELEVGQWKSTLRRVGMDAEVWKTIEPAVLEFREAAAAVRQRWRTDAEARDRYIAASEAFQQRLAPWVVRRDKRRDEIVKKFAAHASKGMDYRRRRLIEVEPESLSKHWRRIVFAAEALSIIGQGAAETSAARARLTISNGHGVAGIIDMLASQQVKAGRHQAEEAESDRLQSAEDDQEENGAMDCEQHDTSKRKQRADFWKRTLKASFADGDASLYDHPVMARVIQDIEAVTQHGEKVLVFGRFTRPMRILTELLNARAVLRAVRGGTPWPHESTLDSEQNALVVSARQLEMEYDRQSLDSQLKRAYREFTKYRQELRDHLEALVANCNEFAATRQSALLHAIGNSERRSQSIVLLARAIEPLVPIDTAVTRSDVLEAFRQVTNALLENREGEVDRIAATAIWPGLHDGLHAEYNSPRASFARMLYGATPPATRRLVQLAFNRAASEPHVLVAQSMVGREGLNLHESCRIVVLLHLEWNPGVVEQQIGRVDRKNSHWSRLLERALAAGEAGLPQIEIRPVVFRGTYDEHHWSILSSRWDEQRAQLHGEVVSSIDRMSLTDEDMKVLRMLEEKSPDFWPYPRTD